MGLSRRNYLFNQIVAADSSKNTADVWGSDLEELYHSMVNNGAIAPSVKLSTGGYLLACFRGASGDLGGDQQLSIMWSADGKNFIDEVYAPVYTANQTLYPGKVVRDPSIIYKNGTWYVCHTNTGASGTSFDIISSPDLVNWTLIKTVDVSAIGGVTATWAPEWVVDGTDVYIVFAINIQDLYFIHANDSTLTSWSGSTLITITNRPAHIIDGTFIKKGSTWYCFYKDNDTNLIYRATSNAVMGTYVTDKNGDWAGWGSGVEGPSVIQLNDGTYRMYLDVPQDTTNLSSYYYSDSTDLLTWTPKKSVVRTPGVPYKFRHGTVLPLASRYPGVYNDAAGSVNSPIRRSKSFVEQLTDLTFTSTVNTDLGTLAISFTPSGSSVLVTLATMFSPAAGTVIHPVFTAFAGSASAQMRGSNEGSTGARTSYTGMVKITGLTPGRPTTVKMQAKLSAAGTMYIRPQGQETESAQMTVEDI